MIAKIRVISKFHEISNICEISNILVQKKCRMHLAFCVHKCTRGSTDITNVWVFLVVCCNEPFQDLLHFLGGLEIHAELLLRYNGSSFALRKRFGAGIYGSCAKQREAQRLASVPVQLNSATKGRLCILREIASRRSICN